MADNTVLPGTGETIRNLSRQAGAIKTTVTQLDIGGATANAEVLLTAGQQVMAASLPIAIASNQTPIPVTGAAGAVLALDGTDITTPTAMPAGGVGIRGWLSSIWTKLNGTLAVTGAFFQTTQPVSIATNTPDVIDRAARLLGIVAQATLTKGAQGASGVTTQDLKDAGRNPVHYYMLIPVLATATDALQSLTGTKGGATVAATLTPAVITAGKTFRVTRFAASYIATATSGYAIVRLRYNVASLASITGPVAATIAVGAGNPATANSVGMEEATLSEGWEFAAGGSVGISVQGFAAGAAAATGFVLASITGYEY